jgi:ElaB/YqjD/DUF883 family membrane-anchored ribosome-binding protein
MMEEKRYPQDPLMQFPEESVFEPLKSSHSKFKDVRESVSDSLRTAAAAIQDKVEQAGEQTPLTQCGEQASRWLNASAEYVRDMDAQKVKTDVQEQVRRNPGRSLLIAAAAGLIIGSLFRRR